MKKYSFFVALVLCMNTVFAQNIDDIKKYVILRQGTQAKDAVDKFLAVAKNAKKAEGWYYKGLAYDLVSKDSTKSISESNTLKGESFEAIKKYLEMDVKGTLLTEENNSVLFDLYNGFSYDLAVKSYGQKNYEAAFENFKKAQEVHDYIFAKNLSGPNNYKFSALDTTLTFYTGISANEAKKGDDAVFYYKKLADANVADSQYLNIYIFLLDYYKTQKDKTNFSGVLEKVRKIFPKYNDDWTGYEIQEATEGIGKPEIFTKYEELMVKNPGNYILPYNYGVELYHYIYSDETKNVNTNEYKNKLPEVMKKAIAIKSTSEANFVLANFLYNNSIDIQEDARKMKATKPDDIKKKKELQAQSDAAMNQAIPYAEAVVTLFAGIAKPKSSEKINYKQSLVILKNIYELKKDAAKAASYDKMIKETE